MSHEWPAWAGRRSPWGPPWHELIEHDAWFETNRNEPPFAAPSALRFRVLRRRPAQVPRALGGPGSGTEPLSSPLGKLMDRGPAELRASLGSITEREVRAALDPEYDGDVSARACALMSPAADALRETLLATAADLTRRRFQGRVRLYAPLYLSSHCQNACRYCHFSVDNRAPRLALDPAEIEREAEALADTGLAEVLLLCGEARRSFDVTELAAAVRTVRAYFGRVGLEVFPLEISEYELLHAAGARSVTVYQETYDVERYSEVHRAGRKRDLLWRLGALERAGAAGFRRFGIGALLGLGDFRYEGVALALHAAALQAQFPNAGVDLSFPRLRHGPAGFRPQQAVSDAELEHLMSALRVLLPTSELLLSTRERPALRDRLAGLLVTRMSAGSVASPGGYAADGPASVAQFEIDDSRAPREVRAQLRRQGLDVR